MYTYGSLSLEDFGRVLWLHYRSSW